MTDVPRWADPDFIAQVRADRKAQGLPPTITDEAVLMRCALLMTSPTSPVTASAGTPPCQPNGGALLGDVA